MPDEPRVSYLAPPNVRLTPVDTTATRLRAELAAAITARDNARLEWEANGDAYRCRVYHACVGNVLGLRTALAIVTGEGQ